jgi:hypothetical protein
VTGEFKGIAALELVGYVVADLYLSGLHISIPGPFKYFRIFFLDSRSELGLQSPNTFAQVLQFFTGNTKQLNRRTPSIERGNGKRNPFVKYTIFDEAVTICRPHNRTINFVAQPK